MLQWTFCIADRYTFGLHFVTLSDYTKHYADPSITSVDQCLYDICMTVDKNCSLDNVITIKGGKFAVYRFDGLIQDIFVAFQGMFNIWLPDSGYEMDERYGLDIYRTVDREKLRVVMDLCIPIK